MNKIFLDNSIKLFKYYKSLGDKALSQLQPQQIFSQLNEQTNIIAIIIKHLSGNMLSRWTNFLIEDGEKEWRDRDNEFVVNEMNLEKLLIQWEKGWACLFNTLEEIIPNDLTKLIFIRNEGHTVTEAIIRQTAHYAYHVGQLVLLAKYFSNDKWESLSIPKNKSQEFNNTKFSNEKYVKNFTDQ